MIAQILLCSLLAAASGGAAPADEAQPAVIAVKGWERYEVLIERNIFSRQRGKPDPTVASAVPPPPPPERFLLLTGVARQGGDSIAFLEDARTGVVSKIRVGESVLEGRVAAITLDSIDYEKNNVVVRVAIGGNLEGGGTSPTAAGTTAAASGGAGAPPSGTAGSADILERLRQRRQRELGQ